MTTAVPFAKYQAAGNDFILFDSLTPDRLSPRTVRELCHRHFGIGADGILLTTPPGHPDPSMVILNADGSRPEMCANGLRCVALHHNEPTSRSAPAPVYIHTDAGLIRCLVSARPSPAVSLDLGPVCPLGSVCLSTPSLRVPLHLANAGNPHAIVLSPPHAYDFANLAPTLSAHPFFPYGTNVSFATVTSQRHVSLRVWERGVGPTLACGTAAAATTAALTHAGLLPPNQPISITLPGGNLEVTHDPVSLATTLTGPALRVFSGTITLPSPRHR